MGDRALQESLLRVSHQVRSCILSLLPSVGGLEGRLYEAMVYVVEGGGKGLRPFLVVASSHIFSVRESYALRVASAVEMIHHYSLVHDDLPAMDDDDMRRGRPCCHIRYDEATAILVGDGLLTLAFELLSSEETHHDASVRCRLVHGLARHAGIRGMVGGQMADLVAQSHDEVTRSHIESLQTMKTGALLFFSATSGGLLGGASTKDMEALESYGRCIGLAFQIADDILDAVGDEEVMGKRAGKDDHAQKATFVKALGVAGAQRKAHALVAESIDGLACFGKEAQPLRDVALFIVERHA
ncbi:MAG: polyprenyl synthetase family protein [Alphaproteobacteria bacterium GM7ARS4]|nr:polyprenyl synthetase family protein [Alphaproteobacteria bacterium GM7ARS4]